MKKTIRRSFLSLAAAALLASPAAAAPGDINWQEQFDHAGGQDTVTAMDLRGQKLLIVGGVAPSVPGGTVDTWRIRAYDATDGGSIEWEATYTNPDGGEVTLGGLSSSGNRVFVTGSRETPAGNHTMLLKVFHGKKGTLFYEEEIDLSPDDARGRATFLKGRAGWVVGSRTDAVSGKTKWWIRAYDAKDGALRWEEFPDGETDDPRGATHIFLQGSTLVIAGVAEDSGGTTDWRIRAYKTKVATLLWEEFYDSGEGDDEIVGLKGMGKRFLIGGTVATATGSNMRLLAVTTKEGEFLWDEEISEGDNNVAHAIVGHGPCAFMAGTVDDDFYIKGYATFTGANMWDDRVDSGGVDGALAMASFGSKTVFAAGFVDEGNGDGDLFIRNYSFHTGDIVWEEEQDVDGDDQITGIVAKGKNVFTIGNVDRPDDDQDWIVTNLVR